MSALSKEFLQGIGIELDDHTYAAFVDHFESTLHDRIIDSVVDSLSDEQIEQLAAQRGSGGEQLWQWLSANVPELQDIIRAEIDILLGELAEHSDSI